MVESRFDAVVVIGPSGQVLARSHGVVNSMHDVAMTMTALSADAAIWYGL